MARCAVAKCSSVRLLIRPSRSVETYVGLHTFIKTKTAKIIWTRKPCCRRKTARCRCNFPRWRPAAILNFIEPEIALFDPSTLKTLS